MTDAPMKRTWLWWLNVFVLQWFFVRLARMTGSGGRTIGYVWIKGVVPLTGWWSDYRRINSSQWPTP